MNNYTKGEWEVQRPYMDRNIVIVAGKQRGKRGVIAEIYQTKEQLANAQLVASAPTLYEELVEADEVICELCKRLNPQHENCTSCQDRENRLKALAKVESK